MDLTSPPELYWHCSVEISGKKKYAVVNDLTFPELNRTIVKPWLAGRPFTISGMVVRSADHVDSIKITHTSQPQEAIAREFNAEMSARGITTFSDRKVLPLSRGEDLTYPLLFEGKRDAPLEPDIALVERVCQRLPQAARILGNRTRKGKASLEVTDEYDVQDLLHAALRVYLKYSVQEDPLPKVAGAKAGRADISVEELGVLIELKFVRSPDDQKRIFEEFSQDLVLYSQWPHLRALIYLIYNSSDLRDPEALEKLGGEQEVNGRRFTVKIVLA